MRKSAVHHLCPVPWVDLEQPEVPVSGVLISTSNFCQNHFLKDGKCIQFYKDLKRQKDANLVQCPYGFGVKRTNIDGHDIALTGFIPWPRIGGKDEKDRADKNPQSRIDVSKLNAVTETLNGLAERRTAAVLEELRHYSSAMHEIRKVNRTIKSEAEYLDAKSQNIGFIEREKAKTILKSSELMTRQFDILDLLANEDLVTLERKARCEVYRIFDKCVRIFEGTAISRGLRLTIEGDSPVAMVCDKTFPILATVLIENAIKYATPASEIRVKVFKKDVNALRVSVTNFSPKVVALPDIFRKGVRGYDDNTGHGFGLHLAQIVAKQHGTQVVLERELINPTTEQFCFYFELEILKSEAARRK